MVNERAEPSRPQWVETAGFTHPSQYGAPAVGVSKPCGPVSSGGITDLFPDKLKSYMEGVLFRGWDRMLPGCRWLDEPQSISNQPVGLGVPHRAGRYQPGGPPFSSPACRCMQGFLIQGWYLILLRWQWLDEPRLEFPHRAGRYLSLIHI